MPMASPFIISNPEPSWGATKEYKLIKLLNLPGAYPGYGGNVETDAKFLY